MINKLLDIFNRFSLIQFIFDAFLKFLVNNSQLLQLLFDSLISLGTLLAVYVALNQKKLSMKIAGPKLIASVSSRKVTSLMSSSADSETTFQYRYLDIKNVGYSTAEKVKCKISRVRGTNKPQIKGSLQLNLPRSLPWSLIGNQTISDDLEFERDIFPNEVQILYFVGLHKYSIGPYYAFFLMSDPIKNPYQTPLYPPGDYCDEIYVEINLYCENAITTPQYFRLSLSEDGSSQIVEIGKNKWKETQNLEI